MPLLALFIATLVGALTMFAFVFLELSRRSWRITAEAYLARNHELTNLAISAERAKTRAETDLVYLKRTVEVLAQRDVAAVLSEQQFLALQQTIVQFLQAQGDPERMN